MRFWPCWLRRPRADPLPPRHARSMQDAERRWRQVAEQRDRVDELEHILAARQKANRFSAAVRDALGGQR